VEHDIVGINEIASMAGVTSQAVTNWRNRSADFPRPLSSLASGPVFRRAQVRAWLKRNNRKLDELQNGSNFHARLKSFRNDDDKLSSCISRVVDQLVANKTSGNSPGMLLGKIQSGKTRAFVGVIAQAFDRGVDIALVLTKGTKTLSAQTVSRLSADLAEFIDEDELTVLDIMKLPGKLTRSELSRKIVIVAKKQVRNLERLIEFMRANEALQNREILIVDDEADLAGVRFVPKRGEATIDQGKIANQIDELRGLAKDISFLQVTATPYSLYLQPAGYENAINASCVFKPKRPAFTELLPIHDGYVGGDDYFGAFDDSDPRSKLIVEVSELEQDALRKPDQRRINPERVLDSPNTVGIRRAIITFVAAVGIRRWQQAELGEKLKKYAMIIHNDTQKAAHAWQDQVIDWIFNAVIKAAEEKPAALRPLFDEAFSDLEASVKAGGGQLPSRDEAFDTFIDALQSDDIVVERVNSDAADIMALLDDKAELKLRTPYNIFVGGNILDRGITIPNLIAFYYGRNPKTMQADTVLQHSRMYGNRDRTDLLVTRFYTSRAVYDRLYTINDFENTLRKAFQTGAHDRGVVFIQADASRRVRACAPNKVLLSDVVTVSESSMLLPTDFQTRGGAAMAAIQTKLDKLIKPEWRDSGNFVDVDRKAALAIIDAIAESMEFDSVAFEWDAMRALIDYYTDTENGGDGNVLLLAETGRRLDRIKSGDKSGLSILGTALRAKVLDTPRSKPALILLQQEGGRDLGWTAHHFWWPVFAAPSDAEPCVFATKVAS
jgi:hypothetical protein